MAMRIMKPRKKTGAVADPITLGAPATGGSSNPFADYLKSKGVSASDAEAASNKALNTDTSGNQIVDTASMNPFEQYLVNKQGVDPLTVRAASDNALSTDSSGNAFTMKLTGTEASKDDVLGTPGENPYVAYLKNKGVSEEAVADSGTLNSATHGAGTTLEETKKQFADTYGRELTDAEIAAQNSYNRGKKEAESSGSTNSEVFDILASLDPETAEAVKSVIRENVTGEAFDPIRAGQMEALATFERDRRATTAAGINRSGLTDQGLGVQAAQGSEIALGRNRFGTLNELDVAENASQRAGVDMALGLGQANEGVRQFDQTFGEGKRRYDLNRLDANARDGLTTAIQFGSDADVISAAKTAFGVDLDPASVKDFRDDIRALSDQRVTTGQQNIDANAIANRALNRGDSGTAFSSYIQRSPDLKGATVEQIAGDQGAMQFGQALWEGMGGEGAVDPNWVKQQIDRVNSPELNDSTTMIREGLDKMFESGDIDQETYDFLSQAATPGFQMMYQLDEDGNWVKRSLPGSGGGPGGSGRDGRDGDGPQQFSLSLDDSKTNAEIIDEIKANGGIVYNPSGYNNQPDLQYTYNGEFYKTEKDALKAAGVDTSEIKTLKELEEHPTVKDGLLDSNINSGNFGKAEFDALRGGAAPGTKNGYYDTAYENAESFDHDFDHKENIFNPFRLKVGTPQKFAGRLIVVTDHQKKGRDSMARDYDTIKVKDLSTGEERTFSGKRSDNNYFGRSGNNLESWLNTIGKNETDRKSGDLLDDLLGEDD